MSRPVIAITMGDPAGIGPEICLRALGDPRVLEACTPVVVGNSQVLGALSRRLNIPFSADIAHPDELGDVFAPTGPTVVDMHVMGLDDFVPGRMDPVCGHAAYGYVVYAVDGAKAGNFDAITTAPVCKAGLNAAGIRFPGHTEILDNLTTGQNAGRSQPTRRSKRAVMMLYSPRVTVSLVTAHIALRDVPAALNTERIAHVIRLTHANMALILGRGPRLAVLGLNCHGGEGGMFGDEEKRVIIPAIETIRSEGLEVDGPLPPDTAFTPRALGAYDAHICMYHDQGLIPFKTLSFENGVNVTLGIPIIRTSVDHGTAFDIAWQGLASHSSLVSATLLAAKLVGSKRA